MLRRSARIVGLILLTLSPAAAQTTTMQSTVSVSSAIAPGTYSTDAFSPWECRIVVTGVDSNGNVQGRFEGTQPDSVGGRYASFSYVLGSINVKALLLGNTLTIQFSSGSAWKIKIENGLITEGDYTNAVDASRSRRSVKFVRL